jgi:hypothetical protein
MNQDNNQQNPKPQVSAEGYTEIKRQQINRHLIILAANPDTENCYMVCEYRQGNVFGVTENVWAGITPDYLEAIGEYTKKVQYHINCIQSIRDHRKSYEGIEYCELSAEHCVPNGLDGGMKGKVVVIKPEALSPEFRTADSQLPLCMVN